MDKIQELMPLIAAALAILSAVFGIVAKGVKDARVRKALEKTADGLKLSSKLFSNVTEFMQVAEDSGKAGIEKHNDVMEKVQEVAISLGMKVDDALINFIETAIKSQIDFSKKVNNKTIVNVVSDLPKLSK